MRLPPLHKKGIFTLGLIVFTESIAFSNAVHFRSIYQSWSSRYGNGRGNFQENDNSERRGGLFSRQTHFEQRNSQVQECAADKSCTTTTATDANGNGYGNGGGGGTNANALHPRKLTRIETGLKTTASSSACSSSFYDCCQANSPSCMSLDIRGGHGSHHHAAAAAETVAAAAETVITAASAAGLPTPYNLPLNLWKVIFQFFLTALNVACWLIPLRAKKITENKLAMGLANAFSGGVFLSLAFGHLIPECVHGFEGMNEALPYMIVLGGYLLIFFVEKVAFDAHGLMHDCGDDGDDSGNGNGSGKKEVVEVKEAPNGRSAVILLGALAVHSILEMTALGLARSFGDSALLSLSIALHQPAESIALLVAFLKSGMPKDEIVKYLSVFSMMGPVGVAIGMAVNEFAAPIIDSIMLATVAGTFIYVGATEVIPEEWEEQEHKWKKFFALLGGIVSIFGITQYTMTLEGH